jgi:hypothetical protein
MPTDIPDKIDHELQDSCNSKQTESAEKEPPSHRLLLGKVAPEGSNPNNRQQKVNIQEQSMVPSAKKAK